MFRLLRLKWKKEVEQIALLHGIEMKKKDAEIERLKKDLVSDADRKLRESISLMKQEYDQKKAEYQRESEVKYLALQQSLLADHHNKLNEAMTKLHEEGNVTTRFTQDIALKMMESMPKARLETKVITDGRDGEKS